MSSVELDRVVRLLRVRAGTRVLDVACGHGELLLRMGERTSIQGTGVDLSPWAVTRAVERYHARAVRGRIEWWMGDGRSLSGTGWGAAACLGASWIWHGFRGTARALRDRVLPGGRVAVGDLRLREGADPDALPGTVPTRAGQLEALTDLGLRPIAEVAASDASWRAYRDRVLANAASYALGAEGDPDRDRRAMAREWIEDLERDRRALVWSVWIAQRRS